MRLHPYVALPERATPTCPIHILLELDHQYSGYQNVADTCPVASAPTRPPAQRRTNQYVWGMQPQEGVPVLCSTQGQRPPLRP